MGTRAAASTSVKTELVSLASGKSFKMEARSFAKLLHLARFHGWQPERLPDKPLSALWDTEIIQLSMQPYMTGRVSDSDAASLVKAIEAVVESEASGLDQPLYFAALGLSQIARDGGFEVRVEPSYAEKPQRPRHA